MISSLFKYNKQDGYLLETFLSVIASWLLEQLFYNNSTNVLKHQVWNEYDRRGEEHVRAAVSLHRSAIIRVTRSHTVECSHWPRREPIVPSIAPIVHKVVGNDHEETERDRSSPFRKEEVGIVRGRQHCQQQGGQGAGGGNMVKTSELLLNIVSWNRLCWESEPSTERIPY